MSKNKLVPLTVKLIIITLALYMFVKRSWVGEDAFIFFRYVDNLIHGYGLVFNIGERVEGFTSPLWVFVLAFIRFITGFELRPIAIILGLFLSLCSIYVVMEYDNGGLYIFPVGVLALISNSAFRDFATSGFETSLTYLLIAVLAIIIKKNLIIKKPYLTGLIASLLVLNRPETLLALLYLLMLYIYNFVHVKRKTGFKTLIKYLMFPVTILGSYQIFRMGYYASLLPNTYYAKKGGEVYFSQGMNYLVDFTRSYPLSLVIVLLLLIYSVYKYVISRKTIYTENPSRYHLVAIACLFILYVLRSGGDYMHGRSLLMAFMLLCISVNDVLDDDFNKIRDTTTYLIFGLFIAILITLFGTLQIPYTLRVKEQINYINDERYHFGISFKLSDFFKYLSQDITGEFGWRDRGYYYKELSKSIGMPISVVMPNIGYFGYAAEKNVNVMGGVLIDPYLSREPVKIRGKIGHENDPDWEYILSRRPTFSYTPFKYWNEHAHFKYTEAEHSYTIRDDSDDSFIPLFDLSNKELITKLSKIVGTNIYAEIDNSQIVFLEELGSTSSINEMNRKYKLDVMEYLDFLGIYWYPYASEEAKIIYDKEVKEIGVAPTFSVFYRTRFAVSSKIWDKVTGKLNSQKFLSNVAYSIKLIE